MYNISPNKFAHSGLYEACSKLSLALRDSEGKDLSNYCMALGRMFAQRSVDKGDWALGAFSSFFLHVIGCVRDREMRMSVQNRLVLAVDKFTLDVVDEGELQHVMEICVRPFLCFSPSPFLHSSFRNALVFVLSVLQRLLSRWRARFPGFSVSPSLFHCLLHISNTSSSLPSPYSGHLVDLLAVISSFLSQEQQQLLLHPPQPNVCPHAGPDKIFLNFNWA